MKKRLPSTLVLALPSGIEGFMVYSDALKRGMRCVLMQYEKVITYASRQLNPYEVNDTTKRLMSSPKCKSVEVINNPTRPGSNHGEVSCINYR